MRQASKLVYVSWYLQRAGYGKLRAQRSRLPNKPSETRWRTASLNIKAPIDRLV
jgi:hypothetical protein